MGRRRLPDEQRRKQIAVRLASADRERIGRLAAVNGLSLGAQVERLALDRVLKLEYEGL